VPDRDFLGNGNPTRFKAFTADELDLLAAGLLHRVLVTKDDVSKALYSEVLNERVSRATLERRRTREQESYDNG
jgi:hypothetical protein